MEPITNILQLNARIAELEIEKLNEEALLKAQLKISFESLKPINLIKGVIKDVIETPHLKGNILNSVMSYTSGYLAKKVAIGSTFNPIKQLLGMVLKTGVTNIVSKNADDIKLSVTNFIKKKLHKSS